MNKTLDKHLLNEMLWDGLTFDELAQAFGVDEEEIIKALQREPMSKKELQAQDLFGRSDTKECYQDAGFSKREIIQSIEHLPNKEENMEKNGFWLDVFHWDKKNGKYLRARKDRKRKENSLTDNQLKELTGHYRTLIKDFSGKLREAVNNKAYSREDCLHDLILEKINRGNEYSLEAISFQVKRMFYQGFRW